MFVVVFCCRTEGRSLLLATRTIYNPIPPTGASVIGLRRPRTNRRQVRFSASRGGTVQRFRAHVPASAGVHARARRRRFPTQTHAGKRRPPEERFPFPCPQDLSVWVRWVSGPGVECPARSRSRVALFFASVQTQDADQPTCSILCFSLARPRRNALR